MLSAKSSLQEAKDQLQEKEVAYSLLQEQHTQASAKLNIACRVSMHALYYIVYSPGDGGDIIRHSANMYVVAGGHLVIGGFWTISRAYRRKEKRACNCNRRQKIKCYYFSHKVCTRT